jgi:hypothetical protein
MQNKANFLRFQTKNEDWLKNKPIFITLCASLCARWQKMQNKPNFLRFQPKNKDWRKNKPKSIFLWSLFSRLWSVMQNKANQSSKSAITVLKEMFFILYREKPAKADIKGTALTVLAGLFLFKISPYFRKIYQ